MKKISFLSIMLIFIGCKSLDDYQSNVGIIKKHDSFTYSFSSQGYSKKLDDCQSEAEKNVFEVILFRGISGSDLQNPLVQNEQQSREKNKDFYNDFFEKKKYRNFISSKVEVIDNPRPTKGGYTCTIKFTVNLNSLKTNLEQNGVIRKFGL
ncbi:MAG: hypothetical protein RL086_234 [Bacteroidota bacterium]|jgi:hypothetical protein